MIHDSLQTNDMSIYRKGGVAELVCVTREQHCIQTPGLAHRSQPLQLTERIYKQHQ